jgi:hypothetical protein
MTRRLSTPTAVVSLFAVGLAACGASARSTTGTAARPPAAVSAAATSTGSSSAPACGPAATETLARTAGLVATRIYAGELSGSETRSDQRQVEGFTPLLSALANGEKRAISTAVTSLVFSHTHVVRLRVSQGSKVVADVGGPFILAPVGGTLRFRGKAVGRYVLSVQDDLGYIKLVTRFIGAPLVMRAGNRPLPVEGLLSPGPPAIPAHGPVTYARRAYEAFSFNARAFPDGPLRISLLLPLAPSLGAMSCAEIRTAETGRIAQRISRRFALSPATYATYVRLTRTLTGALIFIRSGPRELAGATLPGPGRLPSAGSVTYRGVRYGVSSFAASTTQGPVRVYTLVR